MKLHIKIFLIAMIILSGCKSVEVEPKGESNSLLGVVYDKKSNPLQSARITIKDLEEEIVATISTDIDGQFYIPELEFGDYIVEVEADRSPELTIDFKHYDIENVLIIRLPSVDDLLLDMKEALIDKNYERTFDLMLKIEPIDGDSPYFIYLKALYYFKTEDFNKAAELLHSIERHNYSYVYMLLADIYQYKLNDNAKSIKYLKLFTEREYNRETEMRIKELESVEIN